MVSISKSKSPLVVLVTGANGRIGRAVAALLHARGDRVVAMSLSFEEPYPFPRTDITTVAGDCTIETDVERAFEIGESLGGVDQVVHLAARAHQSAGTPIQVFSTNVVSTFTVLTVAARRGASRAVVASSIHATGLLGHHERPLPDRFPIDESQPARLDDWYSLSKHTDEHIAAMVASRWGLPVVALRFPLVASAPELAATARLYAADPDTGVREGWSYLDEAEAARAVRCALDASTTGADVLHIAAPDTLMPDGTDGLLDRYAPGVPRLRPFPGRTVPIDTSRAAERIGFTAHSLAHPHPTQEPIR